MTQAPTANSIDVPELIDRFRNIPTANVGDSMDRLGSMAGIRPVWNGARVIGTAYTVWTRAGDNIAIHDAISSAREGDVLVINGEGDTSRALIGEMMGNKAKKQGIRGFVIDGMVRDAEGLKDLGFPVFALGVTPAGPYKNGPGRLDETIACGRVAVAPGDIIIGDDDGVVVIPQDRAEEILLRAEAVFEKEAKKREAF
ncbi:RraA family protein [Rhodococcoides kyotonense]|uniref:Putative 4-hydroxy-4-methyl-2-oxoglutarate aldolase n=1 Tax=Rhodococcoides kyotonense TaxID=398843 RepID=A0A239N2A4_9NOCA|nr:methyltransferase [Rhodococcus kyotonensis]SNT48582.1 RraA famliy [Rhodococcus kyotonensis]